MSDNVIPLPPRFRVVERVPLPRPGFACGDFVRVRGRIGRIVQQMETARGLVLEISVNGLIYTASASACEPCGPGPLGAA